MSFIEMVTLVWLLAAAEVILNLAVYYAFHMCFQWPLCAHRFRDVVFHRAGFSKLLRVRTHVQTCTWRACYGDIDYEASHCKASTSAKPVLPELQLDCPFQHEYC